MKRILMIVMLIVSIVFAEKADPLKKELVDIKGWEADEAEGMSMDMGGMSMVSASREYTKDDQNFIVTVVIGTNAIVTGQMPQVNVETDEGKYQTKTINGMEAYEAFDKNDKTGAVIVDLGKSETDGGFLLFSYENMKPEDALKLSEDFNWKNIKKEAEKIIGKE